jgi:hypothetical protein
MAPLPASALYRFRTRRRAFASLRRSTWAKDFYDTQRARGKNHHAALRALGNRWLEVLWHCLTNGEAIHLANATGPSPRSPHLRPDPSQSPDPGRWNLCRSTIRFSPVTCGFWLGQAACVYSLIRPPRTGLRWTRAVSRSVTVKQVVSRSASGTC